MEAADFNQESVFGQLRHRIENGEEPNRIYAAIVKAAVLEPAIRSAAIHLPDEHLDSPGHQIAVAHEGPDGVPEPAETAIEKCARRVVHVVTRTHESVPTLDTHYTDIVCHGAPIGSIGVKLTVPITQSVDFYLRELAYYASITFERQRLYQRLDHLNDRLEVLNQLNQMIAAGLGLDRIFKSLAREAAFRFAAEGALSLLLSEQGDELKICGSYGFSPQLLPETISLRDTILGRSLWMGSVFSLPNLSNHSNHGMEFLSGLGINAVHCCGLEIRGEPLGALIITYSGRTNVNEHDLSMFEEFAQGAAVAVANARSQARLSSYAEKLEELVQTRTADLAIQTARAEEASKAKSQFVANMSHELRTPLTAIVGYSSVISDGIYGAVNDKQKEALQSIIRSSEHLKELIDQVLNLSRIEAGKEDPEPCRVDLAPLLQQIFKLMLQTAIGKGVKLVPLELTEELKKATLWVDPRQVRQILINLMSNAVKYTPSGGTVQLATELIGDKAKIAVIDTGVGLSQAEQNRLFKRFERGDSSYSQSQTGTGIGLSLTKHLIEINGGRIGFESEAGKGSNFWFLVPLADVTSLAKEANQDGADSAELARLDGLNILIVDDNLLTCEVLEAIVKNVGGVPFKAASVTDAKKIATDIPLDAALVDLAMPGESGLDLITYFRKQCEEPYSSMPLIVVSACVFEEDKKQAFTHGASFFIAKPFRPQEIVQTIRHLTTASALNASLGFQRIIKE